MTEPGMDDLLVGLDAQRRVLPAFSKLPRPTGVESVVLTARLLLTP